MIDGKIEYEKEDYTPSESQTFTTSSLGGNSWLSIVFIILAIVTYYGLTRLGKKGNIVNQLIG